MKSLVTVMFLGILFFPRFQILSQSNVLKGRVTLAAESKQNRISRGDSYRNRVKGDVIRNKFQIKEDGYSEVVISLKPMNFSPKLIPTKNANIYQFNKAFSPRLLAATMGSTVQFINKDDFYHNVFSLAPQNRFNIGRRPAGSSNGITIKKQGIIKVFCDIHPQMKATIISMDTPYFTTANADGTYLLDDLPSGKYQIEIFISDYKSVYQIIELRNGQILDLDLNLDQENTAYIGNESNPIIAWSLTCNSGVFCKETKP